MSMVKKHTLNVVIPVYNEASELEISVLRLVRFLSENLKDFDWTVTIADNASTDKTYAIAQSIAGKNSRVKTVHLNQKGRGRAVKYAWRHSTDEILAYMDVDLSTDLKHFPPLVRSLTKRFDIAIGTRNARGSRVYGRNTLRTITSKGYILLIKTLFWVHFSDAQCGFKAVTREVVRLLIPNVQDNAWFFDTELLLLGEKLGYRIYEEPVTWIDNPGSTVRVLGTAKGDLKGLSRMFTTRPWIKLRSYARR